MEFESNAFVKVEKLVALGGESSPKYHFEIDLANYGITQVDAESENIEHLMEIIGMHACPAAWPQAQMEEFKTTC